MTDQFVAEIRLVGFNFAPTGWAFCQGQLIPISQNTALFSLCGTTYGGNGISTFALPDLQGRSPTGFGQGPGLSQRNLGEAGGTPSVTLSVAEMPSHTHTIPASVQYTPTTPTTVVPSASLAKPYHAGPADVSLAAGAVVFGGTGQPHNNMPPYLTVNFIIALQGIFPPRG